MDFVGALAQAPLKWASRWGCAALRRGARSVPAVEGVELCSSGGLVWGADDEAEDQAYLAVGWEGDDEAELGVAGVGSADVDGAGLALFDAGAGDLLEGLTAVRRVCSVESSGRMWAAHWRRPVARRERSMRQEGFCGVDAAGVVDQQVHEVMAVRRAEGK